MISRNLCYSSFVMEDKYLNLPDVNYENMAWNDKVEYKLRHTCGGIGKTGKSKDQVCGKQAYFDVSEKIELDHLKQEIAKLNEELEDIENGLDTDNKEVIKELKKMKIKIKGKEKDLKIFINSIDLMNQDILNSSRYYCRTHDPIKNSRLATEKYQKKDVSYNYTVVQPHIDSNGNKINQGVLPALLEELYAERKLVKKKMAKAAENGDRLLEDIYNSTQLAIKVSLKKLGQKSKLKNVC